MSTKRYASLGFLPTTVAMAALILVAATGLADAHHPMGGEAPKTLWHGFLSGIGHPVIGPDHLAFIVAIGIAAALVAGGPAMIAAFIAASTAGVLFEVGRLGIPLAEAFVALSVVLAGLLLAFSERRNAPVWIGLAAVAGIFHGVAFGEAVIGSERAVVGAYLVGLAVVSAVIAFAFRALAGRFLRPGAEERSRVRTAGALLGCIGLVMLTGSLVSG